MPRTQKRIKKSSGKWILGLGLLGILVFTFPQWRSFPAEFLLVPDNLQKADCIVVLRGEEYFRLKKAADLYHQGYAKTIALSVLLPKAEFLADYYQFMAKIYGGDKVTPEQFVYDAFKYFGKGPEGIEFTDSAPTSTYDEALMAKQYLLRKGYRSFILVTGTYHMRRALLIYQWVLRGTGIKIFTATGVNDFYNPKQWWRKERDVRRIGEEYLSMIFNFIYHFLLGKARGSFGALD